MVEKIKIITDSTADLPKEIIEKYNIDVLPLIVYFGDEGYKDGVEIQLEEFLEKMKSSETFPTTSQIIPQRFYECYKKYLQDGYKIISLHLSSKLSGTYESACMAKEMLETEDIVVINSNNVTAGLGILVMKACRLVEEGLTIREIEREIISAVPHVKSILAFDTLENLVKGGRISKTAGAIGSLLGIKPILAVDDGEMVVMDKVRGSKKALKTILDYFEKIGNQKDEPVMLLHVKNKDILETLRENIAGKSLSVIECEVGCVVGTHAGIGACGLFFIEPY